MKAFFDMMMEAQIVLPFYEAALMLLVLTFCFLLHSYKFGLLASFVYVFRIGWIFFLANFGIEHFSYILAYCAFGLLVFIFACYQLFLGDS